MLLKYSPALIFALTLTVACARSHKKDTPPCDLGTNVNVCAADIREHTTWNDTFKISQTDPNTKAVVPGSEREITVTYEFFPGQAGPEWKRSMLIEDQAGPRAMSEGGPVKSIDGSIFVLNQSYSTCDDPKVTAVPFDVKLYYQRTGQRLQIDTQKIEVKKTTGVFDIFGQMMADMISLSLRAMLESAFSFGNASNYLSSGHGTFSLAPASTEDVYRAKSVSLGCFSAISGFTQPRAAKSSTDK